MKTSAIEVDDVIARYRDARHIGGGGQKQVFLVSDDLRGRMVVKIGGYRSPQALERVRREVSTLSSISSARFPIQYGFEIVDDHRYVIIEEYLEGPSLAESMGEYTSEQELLKLLSQLVNGLIELWRIRVVHRDIKPANIILTRDGAKIIDLGIARLLDSTSLTYSLAPVGPCTPAYASPEQLRNRKRDIDHRSDQFSLGIVTAQLALGGVHPFEPQKVGGESIPHNILDARWTKTEVATLVSPSTFELLTRMLAPEPYLRYRRADDLLGALNSHR